MKLEISSSDAKPRPAIMPALPPTMAVDDGRVDSQITTALSSFSAYELWAMVSKFRDLALRDEPAARLLLEQRPTLGQALLHIHKMLSAMAGPSLPSHAPAPPMYAPPPYAAPHAPAPSAGLLPLPVPMASAPLSAHDPRLRDPRIVARVGAPPSEP